MRESGAIVRASRNSNSIAVFRSCPEEGDKANEKSDDKNGDSEGDSAARIGGLPMSIVPLEDVDDSDTDG